MRISTSKIISLLFFILSAFYLYTAYQIRVFSFDENAPFNAKTFPIYLGYFGMFLSILYIALPERSLTVVDHKVLDYKSTLFLIIIAAIYGFIILKVGFFLSTSLFLFFSYYFLGERRWIWMFVLSFPFVALFMFLLHGLLDIYLRDPLLKMLGIIG
ncbi:tripartite tricarboxylate transporter TctB family protein [Pelagibacteraceae bacterium]|nr:tripartite tricarboxylate transporter TctB family protein [Pelagibacteraceae bacterium]MDC0205354.1 tripartite tricarboxylate transporter TctB family protein [Pelagibacteraceae bacterium]